MITVEKKAELNGHGNPIFTLELSQKPGILFTGGNDKGLVEWSLKKNEFIKVMFPVQASIYAIHCPVDFPLLLAGSRSGEVFTFDFLKQQLLPALKHHQKSIFDIKSVRSKGELLVASEDGTVSIWSLESFERLHIERVSTDTIRSVSISPDEKFVAFGCRDSTVKIYDLNDYSLVKTLIGHTMPVFSVQYSPEGNFLFSGGRDAQIKIWDALTYNLVKNIPAHLFAINSIAYHPRRPYFATASMDKTIKIWEAESLKLVRTISREKGYDSHILSVNKIVWDRDVLISGGDDKKVMLWNCSFDD